MIELEEGTHVGYEQIAEAVQILRIEEGQRSRTFVDDTQIDVQRQIRAHIVPTGGIEENDVEHVVAFVHGNLRRFLNGYAFRMPFAEL